MADRLEECEVRVTVGVRGRLGEIEVELPDARAPSRRRGAHAARGRCSGRRPPRTPSRAHRRSRRSSAIACTISCKRCRDDVHGLAAAPVSLDEVEGLGIDEWAKHALHRVATSAWSSSGVKPRRTCSPSTAARFTASCEAPRTMKSTCHAAAFASCRREMSPAARNAGARRKRRGAANERPVEVEERGGARHAR